jgi:DnaJ-class molecular chaperone
MGLEKMPNRTGDKAEYETCPRCGGSGKASANDSCGRCKGNGKIPSAR